MNNTSLKPEVAAKYDLVGLVAAKYFFPGFGEINLPDVSLAEADALFGKGFPYFAEIPAAAAPAGSLAQPVVAEPAQTVEQPVATKPEDTAPEEQKS